MTTGILAATVTNDTLTMELSDGRTISAPLVWYPRLLNGSDEERSRWRLIGQGTGLHWPDLDEDVSVKNLLDGNPSGESQRSLQAWLNQRADRLITPRELLSQTGKPDQSRIAYRKALTTRETPAQDHPESPDFPAS